MSRALTALRIVLFLGATGAMAFGIWQQMQGAPAPFAQATVFGFWCKVAGGLALVSLLTLAIRPREAGRAAPASAPVPSYIAATPEMAPQRRDGQSTWQERLAAKNAAHARRTGQAPAPQGKAPARQGKAPAPQGKATAPRAPLGLAVVLRRAVFGVVAVAFAVLLGAVLLDRTGDEAAAGRRGIVAQAAPADGSAASLIAQHHARVRAALGVAALPEAVAPPPVATAPSFAMPEAVGAAFDKVDLAGLQAMAQEKALWLKATLQRALLGDRAAIMLLGGIFGAIVAAFVLLRALSGLRRGARRQSVRQMGYS